MSLYIFLFFLLLSLSLFKKNIYSFCSVYLILLYIGSLRSIETGTDTSNYYELYNIINNDPNGINYTLGFVEPGWVFLNYIIGNIFDDYRYVIFTGVFLSMTPIFIRAWKSSKNSFLTLFYYLTLYFYYNSFNITRQMIAVSIIFFCIEYLDRNKVKQYIVGVVLAMLFHYSAFFCFLHIWIIKIKKISILNASIILCFTYISGVYIIPTLIPYVPIVGHYSAYIMDVQSSGSITRILLNIFFISIIAFCSNKQTRTYLNIFFVGIIIYNLFAFSSSVGRIALYFTCTQMFLLPKIDSIYIFNKYSLRLFSLLYATAYYFIMLKANSGEIVPYKIWE